VPAVRQAIRSCKRHEGVWFARGEELAALALAGDWRR
jgi:hypothetical protein